MKSLLLVGAVLLSLNASAERWNAENNPANFESLTGKKNLYRFDSLPLKGRLANKRLIWSGTYWPSMFGGISYRWNAEPSPRNFDKARLLSREQLMRASVQELEKLSATEKYDIYLGDYNYSLTKKVMEMYSPRAKYWEGICHGWAVAAVNHPEPAHIEAKNVDGITIPFGSTDVKALLSFYYANIFAPEEYSRVGERCAAEGRIPGDLSEGGRMPSPEQRNTSECRDVNAGAFHTVLTNMIAFNQRGVIADIDRFGEVWNQPVGQYDYTVGGQFAPSAQQRAYGVARLVKIRMIMTFGSEAYLLNQGQTQGNLSMSPVTGTVDNNLEPKAYDYYLELDAGGNIIGGEWISETRPDFVWAMSTETKFGSNNGFNFSGLNKIYVPTRAL